MEICGWFFKGYGLKKGLNFHSGPIFLNLTSEAFKLRKFSEQLH